MLRLILAIALAGACDTALAQKKMYRCGNQYQERPCAGPGTAAGAPAPNNSTPRSKERRAGKKSVSLEGIVRIDRHTGRETVSTPPTITAESYRRFADMRSK